MHITADPCYRHPRESGDPLPDNPAIGKHVGYWKWIPAFAGMTVWVAAQKIQAIKLDQTFMTPQVQSALLKT
jgi:hypothetical protein